MRRLLRSRASPSGAVAAAGGVGLRVALLAGLFLALMCAPAGSQASALSQGFSGVPLELENGFIQVRVNERGQYTIGTLGGDPATEDDDNRRLTYGHGRLSFTSFSTIRVLAGGATEDVPLLRAASRPPRLEDGALTTEWQIEGLRVTQSLGPAENPYTNRADTVRISITATNTTDEPLSASLRLMLDTMIGENDDAPFFVPGSGNFDVEREYAGADMPVYWKAFEAPDYDPDSLKGQGIVSGLDATPPDRFVFASWPRIKDTSWDYEVSPGSAVGDSAVGMYWEPEELAPGASTTWVTYYGLAGVGGGNAWIDAPVSITSQAPEFTATLWVTNLSDADFTGGEARISLPPGLRLAPNETERKPMDTVPVNGGAQSVSWRLVGEGTIDSNLAYSATATFERGSNPLSASSSVSYRFIAQAPSTAVADPTATPTATALPPAAVPAPPAPEVRFPWPLLLIPLAGLPLLLLLFRRRQARPAPRVPPPRTPRSTPQPDFTERATPAGAAGADVTHGRKKRDSLDADENRR